MYDVLLASRNAYQEDVEQNTFPVKLTNQKVYVKHTKTTIQETILMQYYIIWKQTDKMVEEKKRR